MMASLDSKDKYLETIETDNVNSSIPTENIPTDKSAKTDSPSESNAKDLSFKRDVPYEFNPTNTSSKTDVPFESNVTCIPSKRDVSFETNPRNISSKTDAPSESIAMEKSSGTKALLETNSTNNQWMISSSLIKEANIEKTGLGTDKSNLASTDDPFGLTKIERSPIVAETSHRRTKGHAIENPESSAIDKKLQEEKNQDEHLKGVGEKAKSKNKVDLNDQDTSFQQMVNDGEKSRLDEENIYSDDTVYAISPKLETAGFTESGQLPPEVIVKEQILYNSTFKDVSVLESYETGTYLDKMKQYLWDMEIKEESNTTSKPPVQKDPEMETGVKSSSPQTASATSKTEKTSKPVKTNYGLLKQSSKTKTKQVSRNTVAKETEVKSKSHHTTYSVPVADKSDGLLKQDTSTKTKTKSQVQKTENQGRSEYNGKSASSQKVSAKSATSKKNSRSLKQDKKNKTTYLYLRFDQLFKDSSAIQSSLKTRLQKSNGDINFQIMESVRQMDENITIVTLKFESKHLAHTAQHLINLGNRSSKLKICSTFDQAQIDVTKQVSRNKTVFLQQLENILKQAQQAIEKHEGKMAKTKGEIMNLNSNKRMSIAEFEMVTSQRNALEDKLQELTLQKFEFQSFLQSLTTKLNKVWEENTYDKNINEIRRLFGVECLRLDAALPMYARRQEIVKLVQENQVCVLLGETGSGKSTQVTQYLYQVGFGNDRIIVCTQPRKVAAVSLATRVASEMATTVGQLVGYRVGMKSKFGGNTRILYTTDHALLNDCLQDPTLSKYSCVIIDEAHERSIYTDLLLGMLKRCLDDRPDLKVIITSATIDPDVFVQFFNDCPVLKVSGRVFPVDVIWEQKSNENNIFENYAEAAVEKAVHIYSTTTHGDILVFMITPLETERCCAAFKQRLKHDNSYQCLVLHGQVQAQEQQLVLQPSPRGQRKIVFATNSAETSITIPGIRYVVDTGLVKEMRYDPKRNMDSLNVYMISRSSANQRKGRAGRTGPGICYRLYSKELYQSMESSSSPEILKVHLGKAMLKLAELGINPLEYKFVQSPDKTAIADAINLLEEIGAMKNQNITETGKWLTKLPVEPRHGLIIAKGKDHNVLYEAIILSAVSSVGNSIFYRGGSLKDKKQSDLLKLKFCHYGGDSLTMLNVFREWNQQPEKQKNGWCLKHSINSKAIRGVRDMVNEICTVLKKELNLAVKQSTGDASKSDTVLQSILFECFSSNICHFLGHERAGYYSARQDQLVHVHPSSALNPLGLLPEWVIFEQVVKTSKDFVSGLTPVDDSVVTAAVENGTLAIDVEEMKKKRVHLVHTECVGSRAFWGIVGPAFSKLRLLEEKADQIASPSLAVIEADKEKGEFKIFSTQACSVKMAELFKPDIIKIRTELEHEDFEYSLSEQSGLVKVVLGTGGEVSQVLMPDDYRTVIIESPSDDTTEDTVRDKFGQFGVIKGCREFKTWNSNRWGWLTFEQAGDAKYAVNSTMEDPCEVAVVGNKGRSGIRSAFKAKVTWCRRPSKEIAYVDISPSARSDVATLLEESPILIKGNEVQVNPNRNSILGLFLKRLSPDTVEGDIADALLQTLGHTANSSVIEKITVVRENVETTASMLESFKSRIKAATRHYAPSGQFTVEVIEPRPKSINYVAYVHFCKPEEGQKACRRLPRTLTLSSKKVTMMPDISAELFIPKNVMDVVREDIETSIDSMYRLSDITTLRMKELRNGNWVVDIHATSTVQMAQVRSAIQDIIQGDVLEYRNCPHLKHLFTKNGRNHVARLQARFKCLIIVDSRTMSISIKGNSKVRNKVREYIDCFLKAIAEGKQKTIHLKGPQKPGGVMKMLTMKYGIDLEKFRRDTGLLAVEMDYRKHDLKLRGSDEAIDKADAVIETITTELARVISVRSKAEEHPDCVACFMPTEDGQLYRLEACGHPYCKDCVKQQLQVVLMDRNFPIDCAHDQCSYHFMWRDLSNFINDGTISAKDLVTASVSAFVSKRHKEYRYCITPNCPVIYRVSFDGSLFQCCECQTNICTSCHVQYHDGLSCAMNNSPDRESGEVLFNQWMQENEQRKRCPNCGIPVEKEDGCNKMRCSACKKVFCWLCKEVFSSSQKCYAHLMKEHGEIF